MENVEAVWFHYRKEVDGGAGEVFSFPDDALGDAFTTISDFYRAGGNLLLTVHSPGYLIDLGRINPDLGPTARNNNPASNFFENGDNWGMSFTNATFADGNATHPFFSGLQTTEVTFDGQTYDAMFLLDAGLRRDHSTLWDFNVVQAVVQAVPEPAPNERKEKFEELASATVRGSFEWDPGNGTLDLATLIEFHPAGPFQGTAVTLSAGAYEFDGNVKGLTRNILNELMGE